MRKGYTKQQSCGKGARQERRIGQGQFRGHHTQLFGVIYGVPGTSVSNGVRVAALSVVFQNHSPPPGFAGDSDRQVFHVFRAGVPHLVDLTGVDHDRIATM